MKTQELQKIIREEVQKVLSEIDPPMDYSYMKPFTQDIQQQIRTLTVLNQRIENNGPLSEEIADAIDILTELMAKIKK